MRLILTTPSSGMQAGGDAGKMGPALLFLSPPWQLFGWSLGWKDCCYGWLLLDLLTIWRMLCSIAVSCVMLPTVPDLRRRKTRQVALHRLLFAEPAGPAGAAQEEHLLLQRSASAVELHHISFACLRESVYTWLQNVHWLDNSLPPYYLRQAGRRGAEKRGTRAATTIPSFRSYSGSQTSQVLSRWTETTWLASLGWPSGPAGATLEGSLACFARRAWGPSRCHADRLSRLLLSSGLMALQTSQPGLVWSAAPLAQSSPKHTHSLNQSFAHWPLDVRPSYARSLVPTPSKTVNQTPPRAPLWCELNLLGRPCGAGWVNKEYFLWHYPPLRGWLDE